MTVQELVDQMNAVREKLMESNGSVSVSAIIHTDSQGEAVNVIVHCDHQSQAMYFSVEDVIKSRVPFSERVLRIMTGMSLTGYRN